MLQRVAQAAHKALSLNRDGVFRLLVAMTALLCWVMAVGAGGLLGLESVYKTWRLERQAQISLSLLADHAADQVELLMIDLESFPAVSHVERLGVEEVRSLLAPYFQGQEMAFPLPVVLDVTVAPTINKEQLVEMVRRHFPNAEVDDARAVLTTVARGVRLAQWAVGVLSLVILVIMILLVSMTVRVGLRGQRHNLTILQFLGGTDRFLAQLFVHQVLMRSLMGWAIAVGVALVMLPGAILWWPILWDYMDAQVWLGIVLVPLILPLAALITAQVTTRRMVAR
jgi:cell division protein FtsX